MYPPQQTKKLSFTMTAAAMAAMAMGAGIGGAFGQPVSGGAPSDRSIRNDPDRDKTPEDLRRMEAAQRKRERKNKR